MFEWSDIRIFLAVAAEGSTLAAARKLGLNQSTESRRIKALEHSLELSLFDHDPRGYALTPQGNALRDIAEQMAASANTIQLRAEKLRRDLSGTIRLSGAAMTMNAWGFPIVAKFRAAHPDVDFDIDTSEGQVSLERGEADLAFRAADEIVGDTLIARGIGKIPWGVFGSRDYLLHHTMPRSIEECKGHEFLHYAEPVTSRIRCMEWFVEQIAPDSIVQRVNSVSGMVGSLSTSDALGLVPCSIGNSTRDLVCCFHHEKLLHPLWIVASKEAYAQPRIRAFMKFVGDNMPKGTLWDPA